MKDIIEKRNDVFGWLTNASIEETKRYACEASNRTLKRALKVERRAGARDAIKRELFARLEPGDTVFAGDELECKVTGRTANGNYIMLDRANGRWGWKDVEFERGEE